MSVPLLALSIALAGVGHVRVLESEDLATAEASALVHAFDAAIERRVGAELAAKEEITVQLFGGLTLIRLICERPSRGTHLELDVPLERDLWLEPLDTAVQTLFPEPPPLPAVAPPLVAQTSSISAPSHSVAPWIIFGASAVAGGVAGAFHISSKNARSESQQPHSDVEFEALADRAQSHEYAATGFLIAAAVGGGTALVLYLLE